MKKITALFAEHGRPIRIPADEQIITRGSKVTRLFRVGSGQVLIHSTSVRGRDVGIEIVRPNGIFGLMCIASNAKSIVDATAIIDCELISIERDAFERAMRANSEIAVEALCLAMDRLIARTQQVEELAVYDLKSRLAAWLLRTFRESGIEVQVNATVQIDASQKLIATMAGVSRETVNRQFKAWIDREIIAISGRSLTILQPKVLIRLAGSLNKGTPRLVSLKL